MAASTLGASSRTGLLALRPNSRPAVPLARPASKLRVTPIVAFSECSHHFRGMSACQRAPTHTAVRPPSRCRGQQARWQQPERPGDQEQEASPGAAPGQGPHQQERGGRVHFLGCCRIWLLPDRGAVCHHPSIPGWRQLLHPSDVSDCCVDEGVATRDKPLPLRLLCVQAKAP